MSTNFPTSLDSLTNPTSTDAVDIVDHAAQHANSNDAIEALEAKVGIDGSAVTTSHTYKLSGVTGNDKSVSLTGTESLTNKSLTSPKVVTGINDTNGNELVKVTATGSAVNEVTLANAATGNNPQLSATGDDSNIGIDLLPKGTGSVNIKGNATQAGELRLYEDTDDGSNYASFKVPALSANTTYTLPNTDGNSGEFLQTNGSGGLTWAASAGATAKTLIPYMNYPINAAVTTRQLNSNTRLDLGQIVFPMQILANKVSFNVTAVGTAGTIKITLFAEDGQSQVFTVTSGSISATGITTVSLSQETTISAGIYYLAFLPTSTADITVNSYDSNLTPQTLRDSVSSEPIMEGTLAVTASTVPATITPTSISGSNNCIVLTRFDN